MTFGKTVKYFATIAIHNGEKRIQIREICGFEMEGGGMEWVWAGKFTAFSKVLVDEIIDLLCVEAETGILHFIFK